MRFFFHILLILEITFKHTYVYLDDIPIASRTFEEHLQQTNNYCPVVVRCRSIISSCKPHPVGCGLNVKLMRSLRSCISNVNEFHRQNYDNRVA